MSKNIFRALAGMLAFVLFAELLLRLLPVSTSTETGYYLDPQILTYPPQHAWTSSTGWDLRNAQHHRSNNAGFLAHRDFVPDPQAVALIGDSFVEASMLDAADRPGVQLEHALKGRRVFALGWPGSALLDYAERIRYAQVHYGVRDFVVLMERADVRQSICGSGNSHGPCLDRATLAPRSETQPPPGLAKRVFRHSAFAQYTLGQLKLSPDQFWPPAFLRAGAAAPAPAPPAAAGPKVLSAEESRSIDAVTSEFFRRIEPYTGGRLVIVLDCDRRALYQGQPTADPARERFIDLARRAGATVIDTAPIFKAEFARNGLKLDVGPYDTHFNSLGIRLIAEAAAGAL